MLDKTETRHRNANGQDAELYDLVVIGAGICGLNALHAATDYLSKDARVLLVDQKNEPGGMWNTAYDYVRLHQPHPMFTVGDMKWDWSKPAAYLAGRNEIQRHLASALGPIGSKVTLTIRFGEAVTGCREVSTDKGARAEVISHPNERPDEVRKCLARQVIHASGLNYRLAKPLPLSSKTVTSIIPQDLRRTLAANIETPVYVVGGGKTGMDTILEALSHDPDREVYLINGRGTHFLNRTRYIPTGLKRWTSGKLVSRFFHDMAMQFDGDNEDETVAHFRRRYSTDPDAPDGVLLYGLQSEEEHARISAGLSGTYRSYLRDVAEAGNGPVMELSDGSSVPVARDSIFVNCTGSFFRGDNWAENMPCLSPEDTILSINPRNAFHFLTSVAGYFLTHLHYRGKLRGSGSYSLDHEALFRADRNVWVGAAAAQAYMNQTIAVQNLPMAVLDKCGLDLDRWYPLPRRLWALVQMKTNARRDIDHCRRALDRVAERYKGTAWPLA